MVLADGEKKEPCTRFKLHDRVYLTSNTSFIGTVTSASRSGYNVSWDNGKHGFVSSDMALDTYFNPHKETKVADMQNQKFQIALLDVQQSQLRARYYEQRIQTGVWKERVGKVFKGGLPEHGGTPMSEEEILQNEVSIMHNHIKMAEDRLDYAKSLIKD